MKKNIIIFSIAILIISVITFGFIDANNKTKESAQIVSNDIVVSTGDIEQYPKNNYTDFFYGISPRFNTIKKRDLDKATSITDFLTEEETQRAHTYQSLSVIIIKDDKKTEIREIGYGEKLTKAQLKLLQSLDFSTNFMIRTDYLQKNKVTGILENNYASPYLTIVPERQAEYEFGKEAFIDYLRVNNKENTVDLNEDLLKPAKIYFTISKEGTIKNVKLDRTTSYPEIDNTIIELLKNAPGKWSPAKNNKGEKVDQELVISFGMEGC